MIDAAGEVKVLDFGLAKRVDSEEGEAEPEAATQTGRVLGTPAYMSPEQARGDDVDARTDVYALGVVLHEMMTGVRPAPGRPLPRAFRRIIARCLAEAPERRFASARELERALESRHDRRRLRGALLAAAIAVAGLAFAIWATETVRIGAEVEASPSVSPFEDPQSEVPEALTECRLGRESWRAGSLTRAVAHYRKAVELDPSLAAAYLRLATMVGGGSTPEGREASRIAATLVHPFAAR
jgi:hypothetical protein